MKSFAQVEPSYRHKTEDMVRRVLQESGINYVEVANEAAFYGPKIDMQVWSTISREFTIATNQVDFAVPSRFGLTYRDKDNSNKTPLCIHRAPLGTHERFIGFLIEHYAGNFPLWLAPDQVRVITLNDDQALIDYAQPIVNELRANMVRVDSDFSATPFNDFRNNVFYNWLSTAGTGSSGQPSFDNFIDNFYLAGPGGDNASGSGTGIITSSGGTSVFSGSDSSLTRVFHSGNFKDTNKDGDPNDGGALGNGDFGSFAFQATGYDVNIGLTLASSDAFTNVLRYVGARWWERPYDFTVGNTNSIVTNNVATYIDERLIRETFTGTGKIVAWADDPFNSDPTEGVEWRSLLALRPEANAGAAPFNRAANWDTDGDGIPDWWEIEYGLDPNVANPNGDFDNDGYTDLEEYLNCVAAWPAPGNIIFGGANNRYAEIFNWQVSGVTVSIGGSNIVTSSKWQPSRYDTAIISNATAVVDAVGQEAGTLRLRDNATLNITAGWLKVSNTLEVATTGIAKLNLTGGKLHVGSLTLQAGGSLGMNLGAASGSVSNTIIVDGAVTLGGALNVTNVAGFGAGTYTLITYGGALNGALALGSQPVGFSCTINTNTSGQVRLVVATSSGASSPAFGNIQLAGGNIIVSGTGPTNGTYYVLTSTNVALPMNLWPRTATNTFNAAGQFNFTNSIGLNPPPTFYRLLLP